LNFLQRQIHFVASTKRKVLIGFILCVYLNFIIIALEPFNTDQFEADYRFLILSGFGIMIFCIYIIHSSIENILYFKMGKVWMVSYEIFTTIIFCVFSGTVLYIYNTLFINQVNCTAEAYWFYLRVTIVYMLPVFLPLMLYLRQKFGERIILRLSNTIILSGENKDEILRLEKDELLFIKAVENYVEICFINKNEKVISKTFRQTLSNVSEQLPFLEKCHRSYLVNTNNIITITGNSQSAKLSFTVGQKEIPLSKTYYKHIKNRLV